MRAQFPVWLLILLGMLTLHQNAAAQDSFEIQVYRYETVPRNAWELETHLNYTASGTTIFDGSVAPSQHQAHLSFEATRAITDHWEIGGYLFTARMPAGSLEFAGGRLRSRLRLPEEWRLPVRVAFNGELSVLRGPFAESSVTVEFTPVLETRLGPLQLDVNPSLERDLGGPDAGEWEFEPSARLGIRLSDHLGVGVEYFAALGELGNLLPARAQVHQFYPNIDLRLGDQVEWNIGVGVGATAAGNQTVLKTSFEILLGGRDSD